MKPHRSSPQELVDQPHPLQPALESPGKAPLREQVGWEQKQCAMHAGAPWGGAGIGVEILVSQGLCWGTGAFGAVRERSPVCGGRAGEPAVAVVCQRWREKCGAGKAKVGSGQEGRAVGRREGGSASFGQEMQKARPQLAREHEGRVQEPEAQRSGMATGRIPGCGRLDWLRGRSPLLAAAPPLRGSEREQGEPPMLGPGGEETLG